MVTVITVIPFESIGASAPGPIKPELREWQWQSLTEAAALLEQRGMKAFIEAAAGNPASVMARSREHSTPTSSSSAAATDKWWHPSLKRRSVRRVLLRTLGCDALVVSP